MTATSTLVDIANAIADQPRQISAHLPAPHIEKWLNARDWQHDGQGWIAPDGERIWQTDEAFQLALIAEVVSK
jgi:hypothetical protein